MERTKLNLPDVVNCSRAKNYTIIPNELINDPEISPNAFKIYCILLSNPTGWRSHVENIYQRISCGYTAIHNALKELESKKGLIVRVWVRHKVTKKRISSFLAITDTPFSFNFTKDNLHPSLIHKDFELYYSSYIIESHIIETHIIETISLINTIYRKKKNIKKESSDDAAENSNKTNTPNGLITKSKFNEFWELYPKKTDKGKSLSKWEDICNQQSWKDKRPTWRVVKKAILAQRKTKRWEEGFVPNPTTWLNQCRWLDDPKEMDSNRPQNKQQGNRIRQNINFMQNGTKEN